ncbi:MAG: helix-turn-helix domain-containing protein [Sphingobium sp.]
MGAYPDSTPEGDEGRVGPVADGPTSFSINGAQGSVRLRYFAPPDHLRDYFGSLYVFAVDGPCADVTRADVAQLRLLLKGAGRYRFQDGSVHEASDAILLGPTTGATRFELDGPACVIGVSVLPAGWAMLNYGPADALADTMRDAGDPQYGDLSALLREVRMLADPQAMAVRVWAVLSARIEQARPMRDSLRQFMAVVDAWLLGEGSPRIEALVAATGLSARQLARHTNLHYGAPPKLLARKYRALRCSARIVLDGASWQTLCEEGGFYDQSHFIREIKHFIGLTPQQLQMEPTAVAQLTLLRRSLGSDIALLNRLS